MFRKLSVVYLCLVLSSPLVLWSIGIRAYDIENRSPLEMPSYLDESLDILTFFGRLSEYVVQENPLRPKAVEVNSWIKFHVFGESPSPLVYVGREGWLFFQHSFREGCDDNSGYQEAAVGLAKVAQILSAAGKQFYFTVTPNKRSIYPEYQSIVIEQLGWCATQQSLGFQEALRGELGAHYIDLFELLHAEKELAAVPLYSKLDTHWTTRGSSVLVRELVDSTSPELMKNIAFEQVDVAIHNGELSRMMGLSMDDYRPVFDYHREGVSSVGNFTFEHGKKGRPYNLIQSKSSGELLSNQRVLVLHDSFIYYTWGLISRFFSDVLYVHFTAFDEEDFSKLIDAADIVVMQSVERENNERLRLFSSPSFAQRLEEVLNDTTIDPFWDEIERSVN